MSDKEKIKKAALSLARDIGPQNITLTALCDLVGISPGSFSHIMGVGFTEYVHTLPSNEITEITRKRSTPIFRKRAIIKKTVEIVWNGSIPFSCITYSSIAKHTGMARSTVVKYFDSIAHVKNEVMKYAIQNEILEIVAQGIVTKNRLALAVPAELKRKIADFIQR